jgi:ABC-type nitrate/sulfonate/bicarbonate transport system permease component
MESLVAPKTFLTQLNNTNLKIRLFAIGIVLLVWQVGVSGLGKPFMATPLGILQAIPKTLFNDKKLWPGVFETFGVVFQGISISVLLGVILGLMMGRIPAISYAFAPYVNGFYATPMVAVLPLFTLWFGFNVSATLALVLFAAIPPMAVAAWDGTKALQVKYLEVAKSFGARRRDIWLGIAIPSSLPFLIAGFRLSSGRALSAVVIAEFLIGTGNGLGIHIMRLAQTFKHNEAIVALFILTFAGLFLAVGVESLVQRFLPWFRK